MRSNRTIAKMKMSLEEALSWLYSQKKSKKREDLSRIKSCMEELDLTPTYKIVHIAGTNGKGSTASYISTMLEAIGIRTGLFVSPFVISFNERIEVNHTYISDEKIIEYVELFKDYAKVYEEKNKDTIPFFELTFLMALKYFKEQKVEFAVIECGIGGRLDATNVVDPTVSIITNIGLDHMAQLGNTVEEIAYHKLGITRPNVPCFTCVGSELEDYFKTYAKRHNISITYVKSHIQEILADGSYTYFTLEGIPYKTSLAASYQAYNAGLAIEVIQYLFPKYPDDLLRECLCHTFWPGRFELITDQILLDGAHNIPGVTALKESLLLAYPNRNIKVVFTALKDKEYKEMIHILEEITDHFYFTTFIDQRSTQVEEFLSLTNRPYTLFQKYEEAIDAAIRDLEPKDILVITGSLHFISEIRRVLKK